ncbi:rod shape-determining protein MreD [Portibacter marinus]|uniref:rod shape-determining protein MreD n=1 Tax=Portibacter marinus TaxID=2898660 RepID=UPI001F3D7BCB|nr:rod shape-determining protein MreD [Portibacter marinus]
MNNTVVRNIIRFFIFLLLQGLVLKGIDLSAGEFDYIHIIIYHLFILLLPLNMPRWSILLVALFMGIGVDLFYDSPGVHASACVFTAYLRKPVLQFLEPQGGYNINEVPSLYHFDISWIVIYTSLLTFAHFLWYFSMEAFSFVFIFDIVLNTIFSFIISIIFILIYHFIIRPKY